MTASTLVPSDSGAFQWRGVMLDPARHFLPLPEVRRMIDAMALLHLNVLHFHLTDDQGWRFESKLWPKLTAVGSSRTGTVVGRPALYHNHDLHPESVGNTYDDKEHGGFYTQDELRDLVAYASTKNVTIVPEIDMPGHMRAARAAYPELGYNGSLLHTGRSWGIYPEVLRVDDAGVKFCKDILSEVCDVFTSPVVHIGGDECPKREWYGAQAARDALAKIDDNGNDMEKLQRQFTSEMAAFLQTKGRKLLGWDEIMDGGRPGGDPVVVAWRDWTDAARRATTMGIPIVQAPARLYLDYAQGPESEEPLSIGPGADLKTVYEYDPFVGVDEDKKHLVLGLQAQLWSEYIPTAEHLWYMAFPRLIAVADIGYYGDKRVSYDEFLKGLPARVEELKKIGVVGHPLPNAS